MKFIDLVYVLDLDVILDIYIDVVHSDHNESFEYTISCDDIFDSVYSQFFVFEVLRVYPSLIQKHNLDYIIEFHNHLKVFLTVPYCVWSDVDL